MSAQDKSDDKATKAAKGVGALAPKLPDKKTVTSKPASVKPTAVKPPARKLSSAKVAKAPPVESGEEDSPEPEVESSSVEAAAPVEDSEPVDDEQQESESEGSTPSEPDASSVDEVEESDSVVPSAPVEGGDEAPEASSDVPVQTAPSGQASSGGPTRRAEKSELHATEGGLKRIASTKAQEIIQQQVAQQTARPDVVKLPQFPPPASERPKALDIEEKRREAIAEKERLRREELLAELEEDEQRKLEQEWAQEDGLSYRPDPDDKEVEVYAVKEPYAYVQIVKNERTHEMFYHAIEPRLSRDEKILLDFIESTLVDVLDLQPGELENDTLEEYIRGKFEQVLFDYSISLGDEESTEEESKERILYYVLRDFIGEGPIDILLHDPMIEDISCDGPHVPVFVYHRKYEPLTTTIRFRDHEQLDSFVIRMAQRSGKHVSIAEPILDATMRDGSRLQATLAKEVSSFGSTYTIRKFKEVPFTPIDLVRFGTMSSSMLSFLWMVIEAHMSGIYAGGTASGKTTAINALMMFIPPQNKVITIEDTRELRVPEPNWIAGITRGGFGPRDAHGRQAGEIDMFQLLKNALRQRPEYIVVGEVRGAEAYSLFQAMATGHAAYGTMHADSVDAVIHRLESDPINIPRSLLEALDVVAVQIQTRVGGKRVRRTKQLTEIVGLDPNTREILTNEVFTWNPATDMFEYSGISYVLERIAAESGKTSREVAQEMEDRVRFINHLVDVDLRDYSLVAQAIKDYYKNKERTMAKVEAGESWA